MFVHWRTDETWDSVYFYHLCSPSNLSNIRTRSAHFLQNPLFTLEQPKRHVGHFTCVCLRPEHKQRRTAVNAFQHCFNSFKNEAWIHTSPPYPALSAAATRCHCGLFVLSFPFFHLPPFKLLTPFPIGNRWETFAVGYCQMEQILITTSASSVYSLQASPPPLAPLCHLMCSTLVSDADVSFCYASFCWLQDIYHPQHRMAKTDIICFVGLFRVICCIAAGAG